MWKLKGCPRCNGDLTIYHCEHGWVENCLQCGFELYLENEYKLAEESNEEVTPFSLARHD